MKKIKEHSLENFCKGSTLYSLYCKLIKSDNPDDFKNMNLAERDRIWKILKLISLTTILEQILIDKMREEFKTFDSKKQDNVQNEIIEKIKINHYDLSCVKAEKILNEELGNSSVENIVTAPILQYIAGYALGDLIYFLEKNFSINKKVISKLREFKNHRNYVMHNSISSRDDIDKHLQDSLKKGYELKKSLD